jgi:hypothetical protein
MINTRAINIRMIIAVAKRLSDLRDKVVSATRFPDIFPLIVRANHDCLCSSRDWQK